MNGARERNNNFLLDGTDNNDADVRGLTLPQPGLASLNPDAVQGNFISDPGTFGQSTGEVRRPDETSVARQIQFGLRFKF